MAETRVTGPGGTGAWPGPGPEVSAGPGNGAASPGTVAVAVTDQPAAGAENRNPPEPVNPPEPAQQAAPAAPAAQVAQSPHPVLQATGAALLLLAVVVLGLAVYLYGLSGVQEARSQALMYTQLQGELGQQVAPLGPGTATNPTPSGVPIAVLNIPAVGVHDMVVVQGTSSQDLMLGPGHRPDTPYPGQPGVSWIYGRRATFGAPFANIASLRAGDTITAITGQGMSIYTVTAVANPSQTVQDPNPDRLVLLTASSPVVPSYYIEVDARLTSMVKPSPGVAPTIDASELPLAGDSSALPIAMLWGLALAGVAVGGTVAALRWSPWAAYLAAAPLVLAILWNLYQYLAALLPNVY
ncbi:MAG TPA: class E sortase [Streptosporangiaceae bacterium]|nr:class E sortase [Streptosporangiaceae bacterium]